MTRRVLKLPRRTQRTRRFNPEATGFFLLSSVSSVVGSSGLRCVPGPFGPASCLSHTEPVHQLFDERADAGPSGIEPHVGLHVRGATDIIQLFECGAIRGERPAAIGRTA